MFLYSSLWYQYLISVMVAVGWAIYCIIMWRPIWYVNSGLYEQEAEKVFRQLKAIDSTSNPKAEYGVAGVCNHRRYLYKMGGHTTSGLTRRLSFC